MTLEGNEPLLLTQTGATSTGRTAPRATPALRSRPVGRPTGPTPSVLVITFRRIVTEFPLPFFVNKDKF